MDRIPIAVQVYSVREQAASDLAGTLKAIAEMGYEGVEFAGYYGHEAEEIRDVLEGLGLEVAGSHIPWHTLQEDAFEQTVEFERVLGNRYLVVPGLPEERRASKAAWLQTAGIFAEIARKLRPHGMRTGYHNHSAEFQRIDGEYPWDIFFSNTPPEVIMQLDTGNAAHAGVDVAPFVGRYPGRATTVHLKEYSATDQKAVLGEGDTDWEKFFELCETVGGTQWYIVEQETYAHPPLECIARCLENLKAMGK